MSLIFVENKQLGHLGHDEVTARIEIQEFDASDCRYIVFDRSLKAGHWNGSGEFADYFHSDLIDTTPSLTVEHSTGLKADKIRRAVSEADKWFAECQARFEDATSKLNVDRKD